MFNILPNLLHNKALSAYGDFIGVPVAGSDMSDLLPLEYPFFLRQRSRHMVSCQEIMMSRSKAVLLTFAPNEGLPAKST
jgi:hypothetical protein